MRSELSERYAVAFEGMKMEAGRGLTTITGQLVDQSHLHGILTSINALGLELLSVQSSYPQHTQTEQTDGATPVRGHSGVGLDAGLKR
jgi:hypothetical protein